ncbi:MAG TPA: GNAT family N-acetyltransferase [Firmicutes bacterium]|nr:GNAT family N-acetyltransferase [Bacillota bacterium]
MPHETEQKQQEEAIPQLLMVSDLCAVPEDAPVPPYGIRCMREGDEKAWETIIYEAFGVAVPSETLTGDPAYRPERVWFAVDEQDRPVATASCWTTPDYADGCAVLHMVGLRPAYAGRRLGQAATVAAMREAKREGFSMMALRTDPFRFPAIKSYLRIGFRPIVIHAAHKEMWERILRQVGGEEWIPSLDRSGCFRIFKNAE